MRNLLDNLEEAGMNFNQVVSTNVYLDNLADTSIFNEVYGQYFNMMPASTTVPTDCSHRTQSSTKNDNFPDLEQVSLIAVRGKPAH